MLNNIVSKIIIISRYNPCFNHSFRKYICSPLYVCPDRRSLFSFYNDKRAIGHTPIRKMSSLEQVLQEPVRHLDYNQLLQKKTEGTALLVDVREISEIKETGLLPGSIHIPLGELQAALSELRSEDFERKYKNPKPTKETELIFSCKSGNRSFKAMEAAYKLGFLNSKHFKGGFTEWAQKNKT